MAKSFYLRTFECPICLAKMTASKKSAKPTSNGHEKLMYCFKCRVGRQMKQIDTRLVRCF